MGNNEGRGQKAVLERGIKIPAPKTFPLERGEFRPEHSDKKTERSPGLKKN
jgi:hypothetical protein